MSPLVLLLACRSGAFLSECVVIFTGMGNFLRGFLEILKGIVLVIFWFMMQFFVSYMGKEEG